MSDFEIKEFGLSSIAETAVGWRWGQKLDGFFDEIGSWLNSALAKYKALPSPRKLFANFKQWLSGLGKEAKSSSKGWWGKATSWVVDRVRKTIEGGKELAIAIRQGNWSLFTSWAEDDPLGAMAGIVAAGLGGGIIAGGIAGLTGLVTFGGGGASGAAGAATSATTVGWAGGASMGIMGVIKGAIGFAGVGGVLMGLTRVGQGLYNWEWQVTDQEYLKGIEQAINSLYEPMGEFLGRALATCSVMGLTNANVEVNLTTLALAWELNEDIRDDLLDATSEFVMQGTLTFIRIGITLAYMNVRSFIKKLWRDSPDDFKKMFGNVKLLDGTPLSKAIEYWGNPGNEPWSIRRWLDLEGKVERIEDKKLKGLAEGFLEGFWDGWTDSVSYVSMTR